METVSIHSKFSNIYTWFDNIDDITQSGECGNLWYESREIFSSPIA